MQTQLRYWEYYDMTKAFEELYEKSQKGASFNRLYDTISSKENILLAYRTIKTNKGSKTAGTDGRTIDDFKQLSDEQLINLIQKRIFGWVNYFRIANMKTVTSRIDEKLRSRIRVIIWKQWKAPKKQIKSLIQLGIPEEEAKGLTFCRKGYRFVGLSKVVQRAISNKRLKQRGIPSALERYLKVHTVI
jgi:hypothetical protein